MKPSISEKLIEDYLVRRVAFWSGLAIKLPAGARRGMPDRLVLMDHSAFAFVELKRKGKRPEPHQERLHKRLREMGHPVIVIDSKADVDALIDLFAQDTH